MRNPRTRRAALVGVVGLGIAVSGLAAVPASASAVADGNGGGHVRGHHRGDFPTVAQMAEIRHAASTSTTAATGQQTLSYGGGVDGIGVQSGHSKVYLVFYGTQWGTQSTDASGDYTFSGDSAGAAQAAQSMFKGIGTNGETWSAELTQWCDGPNVTSGAVSCPSNADFIPYQSGGVLSGVWYDNAAASPASTTGNQLAQEAISAAGHFGNTTAAANRDAYYVILSPTGTNPDNYQSTTNGYCAWHDWNGDTSLTGGGAATSSYGDIAFSNQPYNIDVGSTCGVGFVNSPGTLDGYTMTLGHEWHEMMSDQNPAGGWTNHVTGSTYNGQENSDECAWLKPGTAGGAANISFGSFGSYAEQSSWSNDTNSCAISHTILTHGNTITVTNPGNQTGTVGTAASLQISATDSDSTQSLTYSATGLPAGLSIDASTGLISGTPSASGTASVTVTATDATGASGSAGFTWTENGTGGGGGVTNGDFEAGSLTGWTTTGQAAVTASAAHSGSYGAMLGSTSASTDSTAAQTFTAPASSSQLSFYYSNTCPDSVTYDWATATLKDNTTGATTTVLADTCTPTATWTQATSAVTEGHSYTLTLANHDDNYPGDPTYTYYDDVTVS